MFDAMRRILYAVTALDFNSNAAIYGDHEEIKMRGGHLLRTCSQNHKGSFCRYQAPQFLLLCRWIAPLR
ncbi:hypothetical protein CEP52_007413 [Fusarium oligoseptatum]|uniref:Uncharacterized protein n=1 Tax=Fusarium oligoseptatum TaxID=2604345 RepID=A0A428TN70_9HYPO|nr:hypothetical protein CEP52_007413 [Fusarium oligoseptatum]